MKTSAYIGYKVDMSQTDRWHVIYEDCDKEGEDKICIAVNDPYVNAEELRFYYLNVYVDKEMKITRIERTKEDKYLSYPLKNFPELAELDAHKTLLEILTV